MPAARCPRLSPPALVPCRCFRLMCRAVGVHPPLELSHYQVKFAATSLYDTSLATLYVINSHVSMNSLTHCVPGVGSEDSCPVGPTSFQFLLPPDTPITISPSVGTVLPGKVGVGTAAGLCPCHSRCGGELCPSGGPGRPRRPLWPISRAGRDRHPGPRGRGTAGPCWGAPPAGG